MSCNTAWTRTLTSLATLAVAGVAVLTMTGCGPSPAYEQRDPRVPVSYMQQQEGEPEPLTSEELAAQNAARGPQQQDDAPVPGPNDIAVGADNGESYADTDPSALTEFRPALEGHGQWIDDPTYGTVWQPSESEVGADFTPYTTAGHWTYDDAQNYVWVSDYSWGWAPFHYGRWVHVHHGWAWIPGRTYAGAWVVWRDGDPDYGYVGWAPMGPDWYWYNGYAVGWTFGYTPYYSYCHRDYFWGGPGYYGHVVRGGDPRYHDIEAHTHPYNPGRGGNGEPGNRTAANPSVGGVGGGGRVAASPRVGPSPAQLGMKRESIVPPPQTNPGLQRAQQLATPRTAVAQGAAAPSQARPRRPDDRALAAQAAEPRGGDRGIPGNSSRLDPVARAPQYNAPGNAGPRPGNGTSAMNAAPRSFNSPSGATPMSSTPSPSYRSSPSFSGSAPPSQMARPSQAPNVASRPVERSAPAFRSAPSAPSTPTFRSAPSQTRSAPSMSRPSAPSRPSMSAPSRPATRSSTPSTKKR